MIDLRDYTKALGIPLCITDAKGIVTYMNEEYAYETALSIKDSIGKPEMFRHPISQLVIERKTPVTFSNNGSYLNLQTGRIVTGVPIFNSRMELEQVVITLNTEEMIYQQYRELRDLMNHTKSVQILDGMEDNEFKTLLGKNPAIKNIRSLIRKVASTDATILITGESGCGKEVVADCIYSVSNRKEMPFVKINCAAIPANLLEAELFGYEKGAFTGATSRKIGLFEMANHGTILLDEIGDFPMELQPKLLRVLQQGEIYRVGNNVPIKLDVRIIAATNAGLKGAIQEGMFREDLYYRLSVFPIFLPPLRERKEDIMGFVYFFLKDFCDKYNRSLSMSEDIARILRSYDWPGNVREVQNVIEYYVICSDEDNEISAEQLSRVLHINTEGYGSGGYKEPENSLQIETKGKTLFELRDEFEKKLILDALAESKSARQAAKSLGLFPSSLYRKAQKYGIPISDG